jgi:hypothetical protein
MARSCIDPAGSFAHFITKAGQKHTVALAAAATMLHAGVVGVPPRPIHENG